MDALKVRGGRMNLGNCIVALFAVASLTTAALGQARRGGDLAASPLQAKLVVPDTKVLPGVPFEMWIEAHNPSDASVVLGLCADMIVRPEGAQPYTITFTNFEGDNHPDLLPEPEWRGGSGAEVLLRPRQSQTLTLPLLPQLQGPAYFKDVRLSKPGRYTISLRLGYCRSPVRIYEPPPEYLGAITTNEVVVERIEPTGNDAAVWARMQELTHGRWVATRSWDPIINEILTTYPDSNYFPYAVLFASDFGFQREARYTYVRRAVEQFPASPVFEYLALSLYRQWGSSCDIKDREAAALCRRVETRSKGSKRPTTRIRMFGREDVGPPPCHPDEDCVD